MASRWINSCLRVDNQVTNNQKVNGHKHFAVCNKIKATKSEGNSKMYHLKLTELLYQYSVQQEVLDVNRFRQVILL